MSRPGNPAIAWMIDAWDGGDPWGSAVSMAWAIGEVTAALGHHEAAHILEIRWGAGGAPTADEIREADEDREHYSGDVSYETCALMAGYDAGEVTVEDMNFAARVLTRYLDLCQRAGLDY